MLDSIRSKTVWVLSGGGAQGAVQVGMMRALMESGHAPDALVATSVGSLNGAFFAVDPTLIASMSWPRNGAQCRSPRCLAPSVMSSPMLRGGAPIYLATNAFCK